LFVGSSAHSFGDFIDKLEESASILVRTYGGYFGGRAVLHCLGSLRRALFHSIAGQNVNDANEVNLSALAICDKTTLATLAVVVSA